MSFDNDVFDAVICSAVLHFADGRDQFDRMVDEMWRVLAPGGALVWVSSLGDRTPIYLSAEEVEAALPGEWRGVASEAGWGSWCVTGRAS